METKQNTQIVPTKTLELAKQLNNNIFNVLGNDTLVGFERAYQIAYATAELKKLLTKEFMAPILALQGLKLGFKTDKDKENGYPEEVVKNCLILAVLSGCEPFSNQFNIISGNCYITKEGFGHLLKKIPGLSYDITFELPRINADKTGAAITAIINWSLNGVDKEKKMDIPVKTNSFLGTDAVIGKATRKARAWLHGTITGSEIGDGDVADADGVVISSKINSPKVGEGLKETKEVDHLLVNPPIEKTTEKLF